VYFHQIKVARPVGRRLASSPGEADRRIHSVGSIDEVFPRPVNAATETLRRR